MYHKKAVDKGRRYLFNNFIAPIEDISQFCFIKKTIGIIFITSNNGKYDFFTLFVFDTGDANGTDFGRETLIERKKMTLLSFSTRKTIYTLFTNVLTFELFYGGSNH